MILFSEFRKPYCLLYPYIRKHWRPYAVLCFFVLIEIALMLAFAWFLSSITDAAVERQFDRLRWLIPLGVCLTLVSILSGYVYNHYDFKASHSVKKDLKENFLRHFLLLPMKRASQIRSGELLTYFTQDIHGIHGLIGSNLIHLLRLPLLFIGVFMYMLHINWLLSLLTLLIAPLAVLSGALFGFLLRKNSRAIHQRVENMNNLLSEAFQGLHVIRSYTMEKRIYHTFSSQNLDLYALELKSTKLRSWFDSAGAAAGSAAFLMSLSIGAFFVSDRIISIGALLAFVNLTQHLIHPLTGLAELWAGFQRSITAAERILSVLEQPAESSELPSYSSSNKSAKTIELRDVTFSYDGQNRLFERFNLHIPAGKVIAVIGSSGAGKSTMFHLIQGLYTPQSGSILIGGIPTCQLTPSELRSSIAHVAQETFLFSGTIRDNLLLARPGITESEMVQAAIHANIHEFILTLPDGYDAQVGERGVRLSGGQKQRLSIARALLKDAPILLLDEATSALDSNTEYEVKKALERLMRGRTTIVIAHRLSTIRYADLIIVLDEGKIVQMGKHEELVNRRGAYLELNRRQYVESGRHGHDHELDSSTI